MRIEVAYAGTQEQAVVALELAIGASIEEAVRRSGLLERFPEIDLAVNRVGIFGRLARLSDVLHGGERVEIYRPLTVDPKEARRRRAALRRRP